MREDGPPRDDDPPRDEETLGEAFWGVARRLRRSNVEALAPWDITPSQFRAVTSLRHHGELRPGTLAEHLRIAPRSATEVVDGLEERGLVERAPDPGDRRATLVRLTAAGEELAAAVATARATEAESFFGALPARDRAELLRILRALRS